ncbi:MAG: hypothetical protein AB7O98_05165 [Hyphomonadaceae bacterium]
MLRIAIPLALAAFAFAAPATAQRDRDHDASERSERGDRDNDRGDRDNDRDNDRGDRDDDRGDRDNDRNDQPRGYADREQRDPQGALIETAVVEANTSTESDAQQRRQLALDALWVWDAERGCWWPREGADRTAAPDQRICE